MPLWAKIDVGLRHHPKMIGRPDCDKWLWVCLILHAKEHCPDFIVRDMSPADMRGAFGIKAPASAVVNAIAYFLGKSMLVKQPDGGLLIKDMEDRQGTARPEEKPDAQKRPRLVYFIRAASTRRIKIGISSNPWSRLATLQTGSSEMLELIATTHGTLEDEQALHERFKDCRSANEWFDESPELLRYVDAVVRRGSAATRSTTVVKLPSQLQQEGELEKEVEEEDQQQKIIAQSAEKQPPAPPTAFVAYTAAEWPDFKNAVAFEKRARAAFPGIDPLVEARKARGWELSDPRRRKVKHGAFLWGWLLRAQEHASRGVQHGPPPQRPGAAQLHVDNEAHQAATPGRKFL